MSADAPQVLIKAFETWQSTQRQALESMLAAEQPGTPSDWAEGFRWLTRMSSLALDYVLEKGDPKFPVLFRSQDPWKKLIGDNPDVNYYFASLDPRYEYRLYGNRGEAPYVGLTFGTDILRGTAKGRTGTLAQSYLDQFEADAEGNFEITLSATPKQGNWIKLEPGTAHMAVRETFPDRSQARPAVLHIERITDEKPEPLSPEVMAELLEAASTHLMWNVRAALGVWASSANRVNAVAGSPGSTMVKAQTNEVSSHSDTDMVYMSSRWRLAPGEALVVNIQPPPHDFVYWGFVILNPWAESYDYHYTQTHLSNATAAKGSDGSWTLVIAPEDPGVPNWLDTGGRLEGYALLRWVLAGADPPTPTCELVSIDSLGG